MSTQIRVEHTITTPNAPESCDCLNRVLTLRHGRFFFLFLTWGSHPFRHICLSAPHAAKAKNSNTERSQGK